MKDGGLLVLDAPNIALIGADDIVEEWFIDKHLTHFSERTLIAHGRSGGLFDRRKARSRRPRKSFPGGAEIGAVRRRHRRPIPQEVDTAHELIATYAAARARNLAALGAVAAELGVPGAQRRGDVGRRADFRQPGGAWRLRRQNAHAC